MTHARPHEPEPGGRDLRLDVAVVPGLDRLALDHGVSGRATVETASHPFVVRFVELREGWRPQGIGRHHVQRTQCRAIGHEVGEPLRLSREWIYDHQRSGDALHLPDPGIVRAGIAVDVVVRRGVALEAEAGW